MPANTGTPLQAPFKIAPDGTPSPKEVTQYGNTPPNFTPPNVKPADVEYDAYGKPRLRK
jgi:hypothetical protein